MFYAFPNFRYVFWLPLRHYEWHLSIFYKYIGSISDWHVVRTVPRLNIDRIPLVRFHGMKFWSCSGRKPKCWRWRVLENLLNHFRICIQVSVWNISFNSCPYRMFMEVREKSCIGIYILDVTRECSATSLSLMHEDFRSWHKTDW